MTRAVEIVRLNPAAGAEARLREIREPLVASYQAAYPGKFTAQLAVLEDGVWLDVWVWESREIADEALSDHSRFPLFEEWNSLVELVSFEWAESLEG